MLLRSCLRRCGLPEGRDQSQEPFERPLLPLGCIPVATHMETTESRSTIQPYRRNRAQTSDQALPPAHRSQYSLRGLPSFFSQNRTVPLGRVDKPHCCLCIFL